MNRSLFCALLAFSGVVLSLASLPAVAAEKDSRVFELRVYYANEGKLDALHSRFRDHTVKLFTKHGMENLGYWVPQENPERKLIYVLAHKSREARDASFKAFLADPDWQKAAAESEKNGKLVAKIDSILMDAADYSPSIAPSAKGDRVFELRWYTAAPDALDQLHDRFRNHTVKLFEKHGMTNLFYFKIQADQPGGKDQLIYILAHKSKDAGLKSFETFRADPDWLKARGDSEAKYGGSLTAKDGVVSIYMDAVDYSATK